MVGVKALSERGVIGAWAYQARADAELSVEQVAEAVGKRGQAVGTATIRGIEGGTKKPGARLLRLLGEVLDSTPPGSTAAASSLEERAVIAAEAQAKAIADLVAELRAWREGDRDRIAGLEQTVEGLLVAVAPLERATEGRPTRLVPRATTE